MQHTLTSVGRFKTQSASKYLQQLCKHFAHKVEVEYDVTRGAAALPPGPAKMAAKVDELVIEVTASDEEGLRTARGIIDSHLVRFAFREIFEQMNWDAD